MDIDTDKLNDLHPPLADPPIIKLKAAPLPREKKKKLRDLVVWATAVSRHEARLRWSAEQERDRLERERDEAKREAKSLERSLRVSSGKCQITEGRLRDTEAMLYKANQRLRDMGVTPVDESILPTVTNIGLDTYKDRP